MLRTIALTLLAASLLLAADIAPVYLNTPPRQDLVRIELTSPAQARDLDRLGVTINDVRRDHCIAEATPELLQKLTALGYRITTLQENISGSYFSNSLTKSPDGQYLTYAQFRDSMVTIAQNNPTICKLETLANSASGNLILVMKVSHNPQLNENEPEVFWEANTHGDEKIGWAVAFEFLKYLLRNYGTNPEVTYLVDNREIWILPMFNPDGYISNNRSNGHGVDMNRNWGWMWGEEAAPGSSAMSESEVTGDIQHLWRHPFALFVSYHAGTECISYPWSYTDYDTIPENYLINWLSQGYSTRGNSYMYGQGSQVMYLINGSSKDVGFGALGEMAWSIEVHLTKTPPASEIDPTFNRNRDAMLFFCRQAGHGIQGTVTDSVTGQPLHAQLWLAPYNWQSYTCPTNGDFHRFCLPGTYALVARCPGYDAKVVTNVTVPNNADSSVTVSIPLKPNPSAPLFGFMVVSCSAVTISGNRTYPIRAIGPHDGVAYQLDANKWIVVDMDRPIRNGPGNDFSVFRSSGSGTATVRVANNWKGPWTLIGTANSAQTNFDLGAVTMDSARYVYLKASSQFMLDAIEGVQLSGVAEPPVSGPGELVHRGEPDWVLELRPSLLKGAGSLSAAVNVACQPAPVRDLPLGVYDTQGRLLRTVTLPAHGNSLSFPARDDRGNELKAGVYFIRTPRLRQNSLRFTVLR
jgi:hypothetical protein